MSEQLWILVVMGGAALLLAVIALIMFTPPRPSVPAEGPVRFAVRPFKDQLPDPDHMYLGDALARDTALSLMRYERIEAEAGEAPARFVLDGVVRKKDQRLAVQMSVSSDGREYWRKTFETSVDGLQASRDKAIDALAHRMKLPAKTPKV
jgi:TolB-like protein